MNDMDFGGLKILVVGDVMLDHYIYGEVGRISPEAPVPVVNKRGAFSVPGGAANVARGLARLGCQPSLIGLLGPDAAGETLRQQTQAEGIACGLINSRERITTLKTRILARSQQLLRLDEESVRIPSLEEIVSVRAHLREFLPGNLALILSDYGKGVFLPPKSGQNSAQIAIEMASAVGIPVLVDPKGTDWSRYTGAACVTPNTGEFLAVCKTLGLCGDDNGDPGRPQRKRMAEALCARFNFGHLLLTRGAKGMTLYTPGQSPRDITAVMREVADVSGAGDTVIATLAACIAQGMAWPEAADIANQAAGVAVTKMGAAPVSVAELRQATGGNVKLCALPELQDKLRIWREDGHRIVFTNGCFDILHPGHVALLRKSAELGDRLIVGLNSDASVRRLKGASRPIQDEQSRAVLLGALQSVDAVVLFDEDTPERLIRAIRPDFLVKGSDYKIEDIAGASFVQSYGGHVSLVDIEKGFSTTGIAQRIQDGISDPGR